MLFLVLVYILANFNVFGFSAAIFEKGQFWVLGCGVGFLILIVIDSVDLVKVLLDEKY